MNVVLFRSEYERVGGAYSLEIRACHLFLVRAPPTEDNVAMLEAQLLGLKALVERQAS